MIYLHSDKNYYILIDGQGAELASGCLYETLDEVAEQFQNWAEADGMTDPKLTGWTIGDCLEMWIFSLKKYQVNDFIEANEKDLGYIINNQKQ